MNLKCDNAKFRYRKSSISMAESRSFVGLDFSMPSFLEQIRKQNE